LNASLSPEYRTYLRPQSSVSPYWGVYVFAGYGSGTTETPTGGGGTSESTSSDISFGAGMSLGAELYLNKALSFAIHSRFLQFSMSTETDESGSPTVSSSYTRQSLVLSPSPALYVRIYF
jgi:outer membrane protein W